MSILDLMKKAESSLVNRDKGASQEIKYYSYVFNKHEILKAYIDYKDFRRLSDDKDTIADEVSFLSVFLSFEPKEKDKISIGLNDFEVVDYRPNVTGSYDIFCEKSRNHTKNSHYRGRTGF